MTKIVRIDDADYAVNEYRNLLAVFRCKRRKKRSDVKIIFHQYEAGERFVMSA